MFFGIIIRMFYRDNRQHHLPHIHADYQGEVAVFAIEDGRILEGSFLFRNGNSLRRGLKYIVRICLPIGSLQLREKLFSKSKD